MAFITSRLNRAGKSILISGLSIILISGGVFLTQSFAAAGAPENQSQGSSPLHPAVPFLDEAGQNVLESGNPVSTMNTCGSCHDTDFIADHSYHVSVGSDDLRSPGQTSTGRAWDISAGYFGSWNSIEYRYLSPQGDERVDLTTPDWIRLYGLRHVGGGPARYSRNGTPLEDLPYSIRSLETNSLNPETGQLELWDWSSSGTIDMNCFLCHTAAPNTESRANALQEGNFGWANTATLVGTEILAGDGEGYQWNPGAFNDQGEVLPEFLGIQDPSNHNCGLCHGLVHDNVEEPLITLGCAPERWSTITTGQIISPQKMADSGMNLAEKASLDRSWDVHAERLLNCVDCHYATNNPQYYQESDNTRPEHLIFDPRRIEIGDFLEKPLHQFATGNSAQGTLAPELQYSMRTCDSCHEVSSSHDWLPYLESHLDALNCESCHIPKLYSSANMVHDWTVLLPGDLPRRECRGAEGDTNTMGSLLTGYEPVLIPSPDSAGDLRLAPHNLITTWFWIYGDPPRPVPFSDLQKAYFENGSYHPGIVLRFDENKDGVISPEEMIINQPAKEEFVRDRLALLGLLDARISGEIQPYSINHDVASTGWAISDCTACHGAESRVTQPIKLASTVPVGAEARFVAGTGRSLSGLVAVDEEGSLVYYPASAAEDLYIFGHNNLAWLDWIGLSLFGLVVSGCDNSWRIEILFCIPDRSTGKEAKKGLYVWRL